jgi:hypothetical protein
MEETPLEAIPAFGPKPKRPVNKRFVYLVLTIIVLIIAFFSYKAFGPKAKGTVPPQSAIVTPTIAPEAANNTSPTPTISSSITPTVNPIDKSTGLDRSKLSVIVQNGSGEAGVGGKASDTLKNLGYDVVSTGNADNFDYTDVVIQVKPVKSDYLDLLKNDLGLSYTIGTTSADLPDSFSSDALVIIGK